MIGFEPMSSASQKQPSTADLHPDTERTGIEPAKLLHPAAFKAVSSTNRTLSKINELQNPTYELL